MCMSAVCGICHHKSWTGCGKHIPSVMNTSDKADWCTCDHVDETEDATYPPRAGTGFAKASPPH